MCSMKNHFEALQSTSKHRASTDHPPTPGADISWCKRDSFGFEVLRSDSSLLEISPYFRLPSSAPIRSIVDEFSLKLLRSGYSIPSSRQILISGIRCFQRTHVCWTKLMFFELPKGWDQYFSTQDNSLVQGICVPKSNPFTFWYFCPKNGSKRPENWP